MSANAADADADAGFVLVDEPRDAPRPASALPATSSPPSSSSSSSAVHVAATDADLLAWFEAPAPPLFAYAPRGALAQAIHARRRGPDLQGSLFFDELLRLALRSGTHDGGSGGGGNAAIASAVDGAKLSGDDGAPDVTKLYPPVDPLGMHRLLQAIEQSGFDRAKRDALVYYLLLDQANPPPSPPDAATSSASPRQTAPHDAELAHHRERVAARPAQFARRALLPAQFRRVMRGYWHLDRGEYSRAVTYLSAADFIDKILHCLSPVSAAATPSPASRARTFVAFVRGARIELEPPTWRSDGSEGDLEGDDDRGVDEDAKLRQLEAGVAATCFEQSVTDAWRLSRSYVEQAAERTMALADPPLAEDELRAAEAWLEAVRARLVGRMLDFCFSPIQQLIGLSLDAGEEELLASYCLTPPAHVSATSAAVAAEVLLVRYVNSGRYVAAVALDRRLQAANLSGLQSLETGRIAKGGGGAGALAALRERRRQLVRGALAVLPQVQRSLLDVEFGLQQEEEDEAQEKSPPDADAVMASAGAGADADLSASWTRVRGAPGAEPRRATPLAPLSASPVLRRSGAPGSPLRDADAQTALLHAVVRSSPQSRDKLRVSAASPLSAGQAGDASADASTASFDGRRSLSGTPGPPGGTPSLGGATAVVATTTPGAAASASPLAGFLARNPELSGPRSPATPLRSRSASRADGSADGSGTSTPTKPGSPRRPTSAAVAAVAAATPPGRPGAPSLLASQSPFAGPPRLGRPAPQPLVAGGTAQGGAADAAGPYARLAAQLEAEMARGRDAPAVVRRALAPPTASPTGAAPTAEGGATRRAGAAPASSSVLVAPPRRYTATVRIDEPGWEERLEGATARGATLGQEVPGPGEGEEGTKAPQRRGAAGVRNRAGKAAAAAAAATAVSARRATRQADDDDVEMESVPGSFPGDARRDEDDGGPAPTVTTTRQGGGGGDDDSGSKTTGVKRGGRSTASRRTARSKGNTQSDSESAEDKEEAERDDRLGEMPPPPSARTRSLRSAGIGTAARRSAPAASSSARTAGARGLRRSSRLSAEPESTRGGGGGGSGEGDGAGGSDATADDDDDHDDNDEVAAAAARPKATRTAARSAAARATTTSTTTTNTSRRRAGGAKPPSSAAGAATRPRRRAAAGALRALGGGTGGDEAADEGAMPGRF